MLGEIIFRGLTLFTFNEPTRDTPGPIELNGPLTAWLVSDPDHHHHKHTPRLGLLGREAAHDGRRLDLKGQALEGRFQLKNGRTLNRTDVRVAVSGQKPGVTIEGSFLDYVPRLGALYGQTKSFNEVINELEQSPYVTARIEIVSGTIRARDFISWDWHGNTPAVVAYMDTEFQGYGANEVVVEIGDRSVDDPNQFLEITSSDPRLQSAKVWPYAMRGESEEDIAPNTAGVLFSNLSPRRAHPVFWGLHFQALFSAAGYAARDEFNRVPNQFDEFRTAVGSATDYNYNAEWESDMRMGRQPFLPFPFLVDINAANPFPKIGPTGPGRLTRPLPPPGHDPANTQICPFGRE